MWQSDQQLPDFFAQFLWAVGSVAVGMIALTLGGGAKFLWILLLLSPIYVKIAGYYRTVTRDLRRLEAASKSPITTSFSDLLSGAIVIRAFGASSRLMDALLTKTDENVRFMWLLSQATRWTVFLLQLLSATLVLAGNISLLLNPSSTSSSTGFAASAIVSTDFLLMYALMCFSNLEQKAVSAERIVEYQQLPGENTGARNESAADWPRQGAIQIESLEVKYAEELPTILKKISVSIPAGAKVGVVGKTGSGKSTLATSFFRFTEAAGGRILIDGVNIADLDLLKLRSRLLIVPQDPILLSGTLREALDPFGEFSDADVNDALRGARLIPSDDGEESPFRDLAYPIAEGGQNLSGGQRQLLCLARALLRRAKVVFFDEASSALDSETDAAIAATIRQAFANSTVVTIAHRLRTIADFDLVLVLDKGEVVEFDKPIRLMDDSTSSFHKLCKAAGRKEFKVLREMALSTSKP